MGIDLLDIFFRIEKEFSVKLDRDSFFQMVKAKFGDLPPPDNAWADLQVRDFVDWTLQEVTRQNPNKATNVFHRVKKILSLCLGCSEAEVTPDAWLVRDLGMS